jgi:hypothetical protein
MFGTSLQLLRLARAQSACGAIQEPRRGARMDVQPASAGRFRGDCQSSELTNAEMAIRSRSTASAASAHIRVALDALARASDMLLNSRTSSCEPRPPPRLSSQ